MSNLRVIANSPSVVGREVILSPATSAMKLLTFARLSLSTDDTNIELCTEDSETVLICRSASATVLLDTQNTNSA